MKPWRRMASTRAARAAPSSRPPPAWPAPRRAAAPQAAAAGSGQRRSSLQRCWEQVGAAARLMEERRPPLSAASVDTCRCWRPLLTQLCRVRRRHSLFILLSPAVMRGEADAAEAVRDYAAICRQRAAALKELASSQLQRAARCGCNAGCWKEHCFGGSAAAAGGLAASCRAASGSRPASLQGSPAPTLHRTWAAGTWR